MKNEIQMVIFTYPRLPVTQIFTINQLQVTKSNRITPIAWTGRPKNAAGSVPADYSSAMLTGMIRPATNGDPQTPHRLPRLNLPVMGGL